MHRKDLHQIGPLGRFGLVVTMSFCPYLSCPLAMQFFRPLIGSQIVAGSTRQQTVGMINQVADCGDGDKDEDEDEIPNNALLLTALVERFGVSRKRDFQSIGPLGQCYL